MRIILIVDDYLPHSIKVAAKMMHELALQLQIMGHEPWVLTPVPLQVEKLAIRKLDGINVLYFRSGEIKNTGKIKRALNETLLSWQAWQAGKEFFKENSFDGIIYYSPSIFWGGSVVKLCSLWKCKSYLILRDIFPQWTVDNGLMSKNSPVYWYFKFFEWINYKFASKIGVMSPSNLEFFTNQGTDTSKFEVLFNWSTIPQIPSKKNHYREVLNLKDKIVFFYGGNIGYAQKMINLVNLAKQFLEIPGAHFLLVGKGDEVDLVLSKKEEYKLNNLTYLPSVDQDTYFEMLNEFDIGLFSLHPAHKTNNFPGKLLGYIAYEKPILGCVNKGNDLKQIVNNAGAGIVVNSDDEEDLFKAAVSLFESEERRKKMGQNGRKLLKEKFSVENACKQIISFLESK